MTHEEDAATAAAERLTISFIPRAAAGLRRLVATHGMSRADVVNRAVTLYDFVDQRIEAGDDLLIRDSRTGELERIKLL